ncbi:MAG: shikimate dehydrogenase [Hyphomicrobiaceae bacterium]
MRISGTTRIIAHLGFPTESFRAPLIYNPYFDRHDIDALVVPMGCKVDDLAGLFPALTRLSNFLGCLITMPHKVAVVELLDDVSTTVKITGSCNAVRLDQNGRLIGDMFDGDGFVRGVQHKGRSLDGASVLVVGCGGVGSAIAASLAAADVARLGLRDADRSKLDALATRLKQHYPRVELDLNAEATSDWNVIVNATPLGMKPNDPLPIDLAQVPSSTLVGEVVMTKQITPFLEVARQRGCEIQIGLDMLFEQIPAYLEFFGLPTTTPAELRAIALT